MNRWTKEQLAARVARDIPDGAVVNLGIGMPTLVSNFLPSDREIILHSENGVLGMGPAPPKGGEDYDLINAGKSPVTLLPGGCYFHHADSFAMMRGGHLDICVLGAFQVSVRGGPAAASSTLPPASRGGAAGPPPSACPAPSRSRCAAISPTGRPARPVPFPRSAGRWISPSAPGRPS